MEGSACKGDLLPLGEIQRLSCSSLLCVEVQPGRVTHSGWQLLPTAAQCRGSQQSVVHCNCRELAAASGITAALQHHGVS